MKKYLWIGGLLVAASQMNYGIGWLIFIAYIPYIYYLKNTTGWKSRLLFLGVNLIAWTLCVFKIISDPLPLAMAPLFSLPISLFNSFGFLVWDRFKNHRFSWLVFPAALVIQEWLQVTLTPMGTWGSATYALINQLDFMQLASIFGLAGPAFIIYSINYGIYDVIQKKKVSLPFIISGVLMVVSITYGSLRMQFFTNETKQQFTAAAIKTDCTAGGLPLPKDEVRFSNHSKLIQRTINAAKGGAKLAVWNEGGAVILKHEEDSFLNVLATIAKTNQIDILACFIIPTEKPEFQYENKSYTITKEGEVLYEYHKHEPVPGEPAIKGEQELKFIERPYGKLGSAICYDFDFPYLARANRKAGVGVMALPSSDWLGITPIHTQMAAIRAIENGFSIIRSTRFGLSAGINPIGQLTSSSNAYDEGNDITYMHISKQPVSTIYTVVGDALVYLCILLIILLLLVSKLKHEHS